VKKNKSEQKIIRKQVNIWPIAFHLSPESSIQQRATCQVSIMKKKITCQPKNKEKKLLGLISQKMKLNFLSNQTCIQFKKKKSFKKKRGS
jgi:hypothetical protein